MNLENLSVSRTYLEGSTVTRQIHVSADASENAIAAVAYIRATDVDGETHVGFVLGKSKVSPMNGHTIPLLELCAAVLAVEIADTVSQALHIPVGEMRFYTDSRVVLGYIHNQTKRFYVYVENRVNRILRCIKPHQWCFVRTTDNPADLGTRPTPAETLQNTIWLQGPGFLFSKLERQDSYGEYDLENP